MHDYYHQDVPRSSIRGFSNVLLVKTRAMYLSVIVTGELRHKVRGRVTSTGSARRDDRHGVASPSPARPATRRRKNLAANRGKHGQPLKRRLVQGLAPLRLGPRDPVAGGRIDRLVMAAGVLLRRRRERPERVLEDVVFGAVAKRQEPVLDGALGATVAGRPVVTPPATCHPGPAAPNRRRAQPPEPADHLVPEIQELLLLGVEIVGKYSTGRRGGQRAGLENAAGEGGGRHGRRGSGTGGTDRGLLSRLEHPAVQRVPPPGRRNLVFTR